MRLKSNNMKHVLEVLDENSKRMELISIQIEEAEESISKLRKLLEDSYENEVVKFSSLDVSLLTAGSKISLKDNSGDVFANGEVVYYNSKKDYVVLRNVEYSDCPGVNYSEELLFENVMANGFLLSQQT